MPLIAGALARNGIVVDIATTNDDGPGAKLGVPLGERVQHDSFSVFYFDKQTEFYKVSRPFTRWMQRHAVDYDLIHVHALFSWTSISAARCARRNRVPYIIRPVGVLNRWGMKHRRKFLKALSARLIEQPLLHHAAAMHYSTRQEQIEAEEAGASALAAIIPIEMDPRPFESLPGPELFRKKFPQAADRPLVLFLSRLDAKKGLDLLLPAFARVRQRFPGALLAIAGNGEEHYVSSLRASAEKLGLNGDVLWTGFLNGADKLSAISAATVFVLPSYSENFGIALAEALAAGLPCVTTEGVALSSAVRDHDAGLVTATDATKIAAAIEQLLADPALCTKLGANARQLAREQFSLEVTGAALTGLYQRVLEARRSPDVQSSVVVARSVPEGRARDVRARARPLKVLHVIPSLSPSHGGPSFALPLIARSLVQNGVQVDVATTDDDGPGYRIRVPLERRIEQNGYGVFYFRKQTEFYKLSRPFTRWLKGHLSDYDLVHVHALFSHTSVSAARIARAHSVPYLIRPLGVLNRWGMEHRRRFLKALSFRFIERPLLKSAAAMHYTSRQEQIEAEQAGARSRPLVLPLDVDTRRYENLPGPESFLRRFPQAAGRALVLFLSRLDPKKGLDILLPAFAKVREQHPNAMLVIAGDGPDRYVVKLHQLATRTGVAPHIIWTGFLGGVEKLSALSAATLFVLPSRSENFGIALVEALSAGLPCIVTEGVAISHEVKEADAGLVVPPEIPALVSALNALLADPERRQRLSENARRVAKERFSLEVTGRALKEIYEQVSSPSR